MACLINLLEISSSSFCFCINYWFEIDFCSIQTFKIKIVTTWFVFLVTFCERLVWIWLTRVHWYCETFKISICNKRNWKFFEMILKIENGVFGWHFNSYCFILATISSVFFKEIFLCEMSKALFTNVYFSPVRSNL